MKLIKRLKTKRHMKVRLLGEYGNEINLSLFQRIFRPKQTMFDKIKYNTATESTTEIPRDMQSLKGTELWDLYCQRVKIKKCQEHHLIHIRIWQQKKKLVG